LLDRFPTAVFHESHGQPVVYTDRASWHDIAAFLRDEQRFTQCMDVTIVDHLVDAERAVVPGVDPERFEVVANYLSHPRNRRIRTICELPADGPTVASLTDL
jgi:NADH:ubiquinone oxidoreductase subunit C